jgi:uncharacterized protein (DUF2132 family)
MYLVEKGANKDIQASSGEGILANRNFSNCQFLSTLPLLMDIPVLSNTYWAREQIGRLLIKLVKNLQTMPESQICESCMKMQRKVNRSSNV